MPVQKMTSLCNTIGIEWYSKVLPDLTFSKEAEGDVKVVVVVVVAPSLPLKINRCAKLTTLLQ